MKTILKAALASAAAAAIDAISRLDADNAPHLAEAAAAAAVAAEPDGASLAQTMAQQADRMLGVASRLFARLPAQLLQVFVVTFLGVFTVLFTTQILIQGAARLAR